VSDDHYEYMPDVTRSSGNAPFLGPISAPGPAGEIECEQLREILASHIVHEQGAPLVGVFLTGAERGAYVLIHPRGARELAAAILRSADAAEAGYGVRQQ